MAQTSTTQPGTTACASFVPDGPVFVTPDCTDPGLAEPYTDEDEQRTTTDPATKVKVSYRYIHGGFTGTKARYSLYFPSKAKYRDGSFGGRSPTVSQKAPDPGVIAFTISNGTVYVVWTNNGGLPLGGVLAGYRTNAAAANHSHVVAKKVYGDVPRPRLPLRRERWRVPDDGGDGEHRGCVGRRHPDSAREHQLDPEQHDRG